MNKIYRCENSYFSCCFKGLSHFLYSAVFKQFPKKFTMVIKPLLTGVFKPFPIGYSVFEMH